jgi:hypothetical protein
MVAVVIWGAAIAAFGLSTTVWAALAFLAVAGGADQWSAIFRSTIAQSMTPDEMRGRMSGIELAVVATGPTLGDVEAGVLGSLVSVPFSIVSGGLACIAGVGVIAALIPQFHRYDAKATPPQTRPMRPDPPGRSDSVASMRTVSRLSIAPVKSMALVHPDEIDLQPWGAVGNRVFCWVSPEGRLVGGAQQGTLVQVRACHDAASRRADADVPGRDRRPGFGIDKGEAMLIDIWGVGLRRTWSGARSRTPSRRSPAGRCSWSGPTSRGRRTTSSPPPSSRRRPWGRWSRRRERDRARTTRGGSACSSTSTGAKRSHEEDEWIAGEVRFGGAVLRVAQPIPRCSVDDAGPRSGIRDFKTLHVIKDYRGVRGGKYLDFGVGRRGGEPGLCRLGDVVEPLDD